MTASETADLGPAAAPDRIWIVRLATGLAHGLLLFALHRLSEASLWPATVPALFGPLVLVSAFVPVLVHAGVGRMPWRALAVWAGVAAVALAGLAWHDVAQQAPDALEGAAPFPSPQLIFAAAAALFIAHHLVVPAVRLGRPVAPFAVYFDTAWKAAVQLALTVGFIGVFWILLQLGAALFRVIGLSFLEDLIRQDWFYIPVTALVFALGVQLTDVADGLIRGVRTVGLTLLAWLAPVLTLLVGGFLLALPFTGLQGLWDAYSATALVLGAAIGLIVLVNAGYQDGTEETRPHVALRWSARLAALLLVPLAAIAVWGLALRIGQHGLTPQRVYAAAAALLVAIYAGGYAFAAVRPGPWMRPLETTNVVAAVATLAVILALFSPLADPARLSVNDQMRRLARGDVGAEQFDYAFLRFGAGRHGQAALARLATSDDAEVARRAREAQALENRWASPPGPAPELRQEDFISEVLPAGSTVSEDLLREMERADALHGCGRAEGCVARLTDLDGDGADDVLLGSEHAVFAFLRAGEGWSYLGAFTPACSDGGGPKEALRRGDIEARQAPRVDLYSDDRRWGFRGDAEPCEGSPAP